VQGLKRGLIELADLILVNKADGDLADHARRAAADYANALRPLRPALTEYSVPVRAVLALTGSGIGEVWHDATASAPRHRSPIVSPGPRTRSPSGAAPALRRRSPCSRRFSAKS
jgi:LAO/AO transport system kinase